MKDNRVFLKVKIKSLTAEARIIRHETAKAPKELKSALAEHRRGVVRKAARSTLLAYGFLRGQSFRELEPKFTTPPDWKEIERMVAKYGLPSHDFTLPVKEWDVPKKAEAARFAEWKMSVCQSC